MKILVIYGTKAGTTEHCAGRICESLAGADCTDVRHIRKVDISGYDVIAVGTPIYMGKIHGKIRKFLLTNRETLLKKQLHFFTCGLAKGEESVELFRKEIDPSLFAHAAQVRHLGCEANYDRLNPLYRAILKKIVEEDKPELGLLDGEIAAFAAKILQGEQPSP